MKINTELNIIKEALDEATPRLYMRQREYQYLNNKISNMNINNMITTFRSIYANEGKTSLSLEYLKKYIESGEKYECRRETKTSRRNREDD